MSRRLVGLHAVREALTVHPKRVTKIFLREGWRDSKALREVGEMAERARVRIEQTGDRALEKWAQGHQGIAAEVDFTPELDWQNLGKMHHATLLALDGISDPQNLGAIARSVWLMNGNGILAEKDRASGLTPSAHKVASGGLEHVPVDFYASLISPLKLLKDKEFWIFGLSEKATGNLWDLKIPEKVVWVLGAEATGLKTASAKVCDELISIPQTNSSASLNVSVAAALVLGETWRQRKVPGTF